MPTYAIVTATGVANGAKPRSIETLYTFTTTNQNISGGLIHLEHGGDPGYLDLCPDAGSAHPSVGTVVTMQPCDSGNQGQRWAYQLDLSFLLTSTTNDVLPYPGPDVHPVAGSPASHGHPHVQDGGKCTGKADRQVLWSRSSSSSALTTAATSENSKPKPGTNRTLAGTCMNLTTGNTAGSTLVVGGCGQTWRAEGCGRCRHVRRRMSTSVTHDAAGELQGVRPLPRRDEPGRRVLVHDRLSVQAVAQPERDHLEPEVHLHPRHGVDLDGHRQRSYAGQTWCLNSPMVAEPNINTNNTNFVVPEEVHLAAHEQHEVGRDR